MESEISKKRKEAEAMDGALPDNLTQMWEDHVGNPPVPLSRDRNICSVGVYDGLFEKDLFPLQRKRELAAMLDLAVYTEPKTVMSIGCDKGAELFHWCMIPSVERVIACEVRGTPYCRIFERAFPDVRFLWLSCSSYGYYDQMTMTHSVVREWLRSEMSGEVTKIDVLFIDGDKSMFLQDYQIYSHFVRSGGLIFFHDITDPVPGEAWRTVRELGVGRCFDLIDTTEALEVLDREPKNGHEAWLKHWGGRSCGVGCLRKGEKP